MRDERNTDLNLNSRKKAKFFLKRSQARSKDGLKNQTKVEDHIQKHHHKRRMKSSIHFTQSFDVRDVYTKEVGSALLNVISAKNTTHFGKSRGAASDSGKGKQVQHRRGQSQLSRNVSSPIRTFKKAGEPQQASSSSMHRCTTKNDPNTAKASAADFEL